MLFLVYVFPLNRMSFLGGRGGGCTDFHWLHPQTGSGFKTLRGTRLPKIFGSTTHPPPGCGISRDMFLILKLVAFSKDQQIS